MVSNQFARPARRLCRTFSRPTTAIFLHEVPHAVAQLVVSPYFPRHRRTVPPQQHIPQWQGPSRTSDTGQPGRGNARAAVDDGRHAAVDFDRRRDDHGRGRRHDTGGHHAAALAARKHHREPEIRDGQRHRHGWQRLRGTSRQCLVCSRHDDQAGADRDQGRPHIRAERDFRDQSLVTEAGHNRRSERHRHDRQQRSCADARPRTSPCGDAIACFHACHVRRRDCTDVFAGRDAILGSGVFSHERLGQRLQRGRDGSQHHQRRICHLDRRVRL